jgi:signal transduction histidine kinase
MWQTVLIGLLVAVVVVMRLRVLERQSADAEHRMRELSHRLVHAQEEERKNLSRELHDHVAQVLTGLRMELGRVERMNIGVRPTVTECKRLVDNMFDTVRNLSLGLRPSMLDDFGLQAALEWLTRDLMGRSAIKVELDVEGDFDSLPEAHRTCVYRVVQEATTNCMRHAHASSIEITVCARGGQLHVSVSDDGIGVNPSSRRSGLGIRGIEERVNELSGTTTISCGAGGGTNVAVRLPLPPVVKEAVLACAVS